MLTDEREKARVIALNRWPTEQTENMNTMDTTSSNSTPAPERQPSKELEGLLAQALTHDKRGQYEEMLESAQHAIEVDSGSALAFACKARALQKLDRISEATIANDQALLLDTALPLAWINRSGLQVLQKRFADALRSATRSTELAPDDARAWINAGMAHINLHNLSAALDAMNQGLALDPDNLLALQMKGEILYRCGRVRELASFMQDALESYPDDIQLLTLIIEALRSTEDYAEIAPYTSHLIQLMPDNRFAWDCHMRTLRSLGQFLEAGEAIDRLLELEPDEVRYWTLKADNLYRLERYREAVSVAEYALQIDPQFPPAKRIHEKALKLMYQRKNKKK